MIVESHLAQYESLIKSAKESFLMTFKWILWPLQIFALGVMGMAFTAGILWLLPTVTNPWFLYIILSIGNGLAFVFAFGITWLQIYFSERRLNKLKEKLNE